jgi:hypothetical protein
VSQNLTKDQKDYNTKNSTLLRRSEEEREKVLKNVLARLKSKSEPFDKAFSNLVNDSLNPINQLGSDTKDQAIDLVILSTIDGSEEYQEHFVSLDSLTATEKIILEMLLNRTGHPNWRQSSTTSESMSEFKLCQVFTSNVVHVYFAARVQSKPRVLSFF